MKHNPFKIVSDFEETVADYCGSPYAVATDSCTSAIFLCVKYWLMNNEVQKCRDQSRFQSHFRIGIGLRDWITENYDSQKPAITIPSKTYISPAMSILHAGAELKIDTSVKWSGIYQLKPTNIYDAAKRLTSGMYLPGSMMCLSFHIKKHLKLGKGGMILTDSLEARDWLRKASYEGRSRDKGIHEDNVEFAGWNFYMTPQTAANGLALMQNYPENVPDLPNSYRDLVTFEVFKNCKII